jgi:hypothetical protein
MLRPGKRVAHSMDRFEGWSGRRGARGSAVLLICVGLALTLGVAALSATSAPSFARARSYATGRAPISVAIGDLNGDGKPDLATANFKVGVNTVSVLLNRGDGSFQAQRGYRTGRRPSSVAVGDLNSDDKPDLATANNAGGVNTVSVLLNRGDGSFQAKVDYRSGSSPLSVAIGDLNGDGRADLATANSEASTVSVLLNGGDGIFQGKLDYATGGAPESVAIGDLNGDGKPDIVTANLANTVSVLLNRGDGSFQAKRDYGTEGLSFSVAMGDVNRDGNPDLATANEGNTVSVLLNRGDGSFRAKHDYRIGTEPTSVAIGDLNGDGKPDLVSATAGANTVSVLANRGDGSFRAELEYRSGNGSYSIGIGDLNGDGKSDLVSANVTPSTVSVLINTPGLCTVQNVGRRFLRESNLVVQAQTLPAAKRTIARANCRVGTIRHAYSKTVKRGRVISQKPEPGTVLRGGGKVNLVVSRGRRSS